MRQSASTGLATMVAKAVRSVLADSPELLFNWDEKLRRLVCGICLSRSLLLQDIAQTMPGVVKTTEDSLSDFLARQRLKLHGAQRAAVIAALKRRGRRRIWKYDGKVALVCDTTEYAKARSRGKVRPMPGKGLVRVHNLPTDETILVPGYQEVWVCLLLEDGTALPLVRRLWSENGPTCASMNIIEEAAISDARDLVKEALKLDVILVADRGFRRKSLLRWLKGEGMDFVIRLEGKLTVALGEDTGLLAEMSNWWRERLKMPWRDKAKQVLVSSVASRRVRVRTESQESFCFNVLCLTPVRATVEPMFLATTLTTERVSDLIRIVRLYSRRWAIETFFWEFKQGLNGDSWRVFSQWHAIDHLLTAAHIAFLVLALLEDYARRGRTAALRGTWDWMGRVLRERFARPPERTRGRFMQIIAMDFPSPCLAGVLV